MGRVVLTLISTLFLIMTGTFATKGLFDIPASYARIPSYAGLEMTSVKEFGAIGDGQTDDTAAIQAAIDAMPETGGVIYLPIGTYLVRPLTCTKPVRFTGPRPGTHREGKPEGATLLAAGNQTHILKFGGKNNTLAYWVMGGELENISFSGGYNTLSDALLVLQYFQFGKLSNVFMYMGNCRAIRFKNVMDLGIDTLKLISAGRDGDCVMYIDACESPYWTNEIRFYGKCQWENNLGSILKCSPDSYGDGIFFDGVDFERSIKYDKTPVPVFDIADLNRLSILNCSFANYDDAVNTVFADLKAGNNRFTTQVDIRGNKLINSVFTLKVGTGASGVVCKDNIASWTNSILTLDNSSCLGGVIFEPLMGYDARAKHDLLFVNHRTPFIPIVDIGTNTNRFVKDVSKESLGTTGLLYKSNNGVDTVGYFSLKQFANYPGDIQLWVRAKGSSDRGALQVAYTTSYSPEGAQLFGTTWGWRCYTITRGELANPTNYNSVCCISVPPNSDTIYVDGIYIIPVPQQYNGSTWDRLYFVRGTPSAGYVIKWNAAGFAMWAAP